MDRVTLKGNARALLLGHYGVFIRIFLLTQLIIYLLNRLIDSMTYGVAQGPLISLIASILIELFAGILVGGTAYAYLRFAAGNPVKTSDLFYCFRNRPDRAILLQGIMVLASTICFVPGELMYVLHKGPLTPVFACQLIAVLGIGLVVYVIFYTNFTFLFYLMLDFPNHSVPDLVRLCVRMMKGYRKEVLLLLLSFLPFYLLGILSFGIGLFWVIPYVNTTRVQFYLTMLEEQSKQA